MIRRIVLQLGHRAGILLDLYEFAVVIPDVFVGTVVGKVAPRVVLARGAADGGVFVDKIDEVRGLFTWVENAVAVHIVFDAPYRTLASAGTVAVADYVEIEHRPAIITRRCYILVKVTGLSSLILLFWS